MTILCSGRRARYKGCCNNAEASSLVNCMAPLNQKSV
jgi:hypothetical protein